MKSGIFRLKFSVHSIHFREYIVQKEEHMLRPGSFHNFKYFPAPSTLSSGASSSKYKYKMYVPISAPLHSR